MNKKIILKPDTVIWIIALIYILLPIIIFLAGWTKVPFLCAGIILLALLGYKVICDVNGQENIPELINRKNIFFWAATTICICIWIYFSGIGSFVYQNSDFWVRNPIYRDLCNTSWPVYYDLSQEPMTVQNLIGTDKVAFSYYFTWWLTPALICKIFKFDGIMCNIVLYIHTVIGILITHYFLCRLVRKCSWKCILVFIFFSGLDVLAYWLKNQSLPGMTQHIEWSLGLFQYSGNTTQLYWVFNQSVPIWIITAMVLSLTSTGVIAGVGGVGSLSFAYSPWATFGMIPICIYGLLKGDVSTKNEHSRGRLNWTIKFKNIKEALTISNILIPAFILVVFGFFYIAGGQMSGGFRFYMLSSGNSWRMFAVKYILFIVTEIGFYFIVLGKVARKYPYYYIVLAELLAFPLIILRDGNFIMRGSIPALFILMVFVITFLVQESDGKESHIRKIVLYGILMIGAVTSLNEINRSIINTINSDEILQNDIKTFAYIDNENEYEILTANVQFFVHDYKNKFFFKYIAK